MDRTSVLVKFPAPLLARVEAFAKAEGKNRMAAILLLIERGLEGGARAVDAGPKIGPSFSHGRSKTVVAGPASVRAEALAQRQKAENERMAGWFSPKGKK